MTILPSILVADDDENDIFFMQRAFKGADVQNPLYLAHDGQEAIDVLSGEGKYSDRKQYPFPGRFELEAGPIRPAMHSCDNFLFVCASARY